MVVNSIDGSAAVWLWRRKAREPERHTKVRIRFIGRQTGESERLLEDALSRELRQDGRVMRACLARVEYDDSAAHQVALCLKGPEDLEIVRQMSARFAETFAKGTHMDILFLTEEQEELLRCVCEPFYAANGPGE